MLNKKKGVSLVTVLLFMLIATIAATATYKWLSSEQRSSASRMKVAEAQQASRAGLDAVRAWMTFNANDVGALMHQYYAENKKPIRLDNVVKAFGSSKQNYSVWLTGVDTTHNPYKLKINSVGKSRDNAKYSEVSVLKVGGLYRVKIPQEMSSLNFDQAFSGKLGTVTSQNILQSGLINGDLGGNTPKVLTDMVVTGNVAYQGGSNQGRDLYIKGNFDNRGSMTIGQTDASGACTEGIDTNVLYIGGSMTGCANLLTVCGDLYVGGNIIDNCQLYVSGNMTMNGALKRGDYKGWKVGKNMVFTEHASLDLVSRNIGDETQNTIGKNAYFPKWIEGHCNGSSCGDDDGQRLMSIGGDVYYYEATTFTPTFPMFPGMGMPTGPNRYYELFNQGSPLTYGAFMQGTKQADVDDGDTRKKKRMLSFSANSLKKSNADLIKKWEKTDNVLKKIGDNYWARIDKMNAYGRLIDEGDTIPQPILLKNANDWVSNPKNDVCFTNGYKINYNDGLDGNNIKMLNGCYKKLKADSPDDLYNEFLVVRLHSQNAAGGVDTMLDGKFVLYFDGKVGTLSVPPTKENATVMLYFTQGAGTLQKNGNGEFYHYFIYSEGNIDVLQNKLTIQGSVIMANGSKMGDLRDGSLYYEKSVLSALITAGIIKENPDYTKRANPDAASDASESTTSLQSDSYFIATAPQLNISLESQYKNKDVDPESLNLDDYTTVQPSVVVLPRVIYLTQDARGRLEDYYSLINLNGASLAKTAANASCDPTLPTIGALRSGSATLGSGIYACKYTTTYGEMPFWVVVDGQKGTTPKINFESSGKNIVPGSAPTTVKLVYERSSQQGSMTIDVRITGKPANWVIQPVAGVAAMHAVSATTEDDLYYTVTMPTNASSVDAFVITVPTGASGGTAVFELIPPNNGCVIGNTNPTYSANVTGFANISRANIPMEYCGEDGHEKLHTTAGVEFDCATVVSSDWPNCTPSMISGEWVYPYCNSLSTTTTNESWVCGTNLGIHLNKRVVPELCEVFIADTVLEAENDKSYTLFASAKRKRYTLRVGMENNNSGASTKVFAVSGETQTELTAENVDDDGYKVYHVYAGQTLNVEAIEGSDNKFSHWRCSGSSCNGRESYKRKLFNELNVQSNVTLTASYNERDKHCFYDSFGTKESSIGTDEKFKNQCKDVSSTYENCIDQCKSGLNCAVSSGNHPAANWTSVYANEANYFGVSACVGGWGASGCKRYAPKQFEPPEYKSSDNSFKAPDILSGNSSVYSPTVLLNRVQAGFNGTMTMKVTIPGGITDAVTKVFSSVGDHNEGLIFRSNADATKYLSLNVFRGKVLSGQDWGVYARVCYAETQYVADNADCIEQDLTNKYNGNFVPATALADMTVKAVLNGSTLDVSISYNGSSREYGTTSFNLMNLDNTSLATREVNREYYVGLKLYNTHYTYRDVSWMSDDYSNQCFDTPRIYCSFKSKYLGGTVPKGENTTPWVGWSSWFDEQAGSGCTDVKYYYNGCDVRGSEHFVFREGLNTATCSGNDALGGFWYEGVEMSDGLYYFTEEGNHRIPVTQQMIFDLQRSGYAKKATAIITCGGDDYAADCGEFYVGEIRPCSENVKIYASADPKYCASDESCVMMLDGTKTVNVRDADLSITVNDFSQGKILVRLVDENDIMSEAFEISAAGTFSMNVNSYANVDGFDPQKIRGVIMTGSSGYSVASIESACRNAPGIGTGCTASMNLSGSGFNVSAPNINHPEMAAQNGCVITNEQGLLSPVAAECAIDGNFFVPIGSLLNTINSGEAGERDLSFSIKMTDESGNETSCRTGNVTVKKTSMSCSVAQSTIYEGESLPDFSYSLVDCPAGGCEAFVELVETDEQQTVLCQDASGSCLQQTWSSEANTTKGTYTYKLSYSTLTPCTATVSVVESSPASASKCKIEDGKFKAEITPATSGTTTARLFYNDVLGNQIGQDKSVTTSNRNYEEALSSITVDGSYTIVLALNGHEACSVGYQVSGGSGSTTSSSSVANSSSSAPAEEITATCKIRNNQDAVTKAYVGSGLNIFIENVQGTSGNFDAKLYQGTSPISDVGCGTGGCWNNTFTAPSTAGTYTYSLKNGDKTVCSVNLTVETPSMTCRVEDSSGNEISQGTKVASGSGYKLVWQCNQSNSTSFGMNVKENGSYLGGATCTNGVCEYSVSNASAGTYTYAVDGKWNCDVSTECTNVVEVEGGASYPSFGTVLVNGDKTTAAQGLMTANQWYSVSLGARDYPNAKLRIGYWEESPNDFTIEYTDCNGTSQTGTVYTKKETAYENGPWTHNEFDLGAKENQTCDINVKISESVWLSVNIW